MNRWVVVVVAYAVLALGALSARWFWLDSDPLSAPDAWLDLGGMSHVYSALLGLTLGGALVLGTRASVGRYVWASRLHVELRPLASDISPAWIWLLAALSAIGEELLFRGVLQPTLGLVGQAVLFGLVHQLPGKSRWVWALWAGLVGALLGLLWALTGSLVGPILAHAVVNAMNLKYLKAYDPREPTRSMGGLLNQRG
jgi:uncharacterized protein